jgi:titin
VRAINAAGTGDWAQTGLVRVTAMTEPGAPRTVEATSPSCGTVTVTWSAPTDDGGSDITSYTVEIDDRSGESGCASSFKRSTSQVVPATTATFTGLTGTGYCVRVAAANAVGDSVWVQAGVVAMSASAPGAPRNLGGAGTAKTTVDLVWDGPSSDGGATVTDYVVEFRKQGAREWTVFADGVSDDTDAKVTGLSSSTTYDFRVAAVNRVGTGSYTDEFSHKPGK